MRELLEVIDSNLAEINKVYEPASEGEAELMKTLRLPSVKL
jgi:hypothetical protein